jgi:hypothetical protein
MTMMDMDIQSVSVETKTIAKPMNIIIGVIKTIDKKQYEKTDKKNSKKRQRSDSVAVPTKIKPKLKLVKPKLTPKTKTIISKSNLKQKSKNINNINNNNNNNNDNETTTKMTDTSSITTSTTRNNTSTVPVNVNGTVESPLHTTVESRATYNHILRLGVQTKSTFRCSGMAGRRQCRMYERKCLPLDCQTTLAKNESGRDNDDGVGQIHSPTTSSTKSDPLHIPIIHSNSELSINRLHWMCLPELLSEEVWYRHRYSLSDIRRTLDVFPARIIWQLVISYNRPATNASSRVCLDTEHRLSCGSRSTAIQKLLLILKELHSDLQNHESVIWTRQNHSKSNSSFSSKNDNSNSNSSFNSSMNDSKSKSNSTNCANPFKHSPGLPVHRINAQTFTEMEKYLVTSSTVMNRAERFEEARQAACRMIFNQKSRKVSKPTPTNATTSLITATTSSTTTATTTTKNIPLSVVPDAFNSVKTVKAIFSWRNILIVPLEINPEKDLLLMNRVVPWETYLKAYGTPLNLRHFPNIVRAPEGFYALMDEAFFFFVDRDNEITNLEDSSKTSIQNQNTEYPTLPDPPLLVKLENLTGENDESNHRSKEHQRLELFSTTSASSSSSFRNDLTSRTVDQEENRATKRLKPS